MTNGHHWLAGPMGEIGTEMNEQTMEKLVMAAWKETEKEHKNYLAERIKRGNEKLNKAHSTNGKYLHQWIRQDHQTPSATMNRQTKRQKGVHNEIETLCFDDMVLWRKKSAAMQAVICENVARNHHDELPRDSPDTRRSAETDFRQVGWRRGDTLL